MNICICPPNLLTIRGASNDIEKATALARAMVTQYGMTEAIGAIKLGSDASQPFMGRDYGHQRDY